MDSRRKFQIGLGIAIIAAGLITNSSFWGIGVFMLFAGAFNLCPTCRDGACEIDPNKNKSDINEEKIN